MVILDGKSLTLPEVIRVAVDGEAAALSEAGKEQIKRSRKIVDKIWNFGENGTISFCNIR